MRTAEGDLASAGLFVWDDRWSWNLANGRIAESGATGAPTALLWHAIGRALERGLGRRLDLDARYYAWEDAWPGADQRWDLAHGRTPFITWEPWGTTPEAIAAGREDAVIRAAARRVRGFGGRVVLRWGHEMNGSWYPWAGGRRPAARARAYVRAWKRIHRLFTRHGARNVTWVWSPNAEDVPATRANHWSAYYPGDRYVDWVGIDAYNFGTTQRWSRWRSLADVAMPLARAYGRRKPIILAETGSVSTGGDRAAWLDEAADEVRALPGLRAIVYFDAGRKWSLPRRSRDLGALGRLFGTS
ncbi:MAG: hypothetical protein KY463_13035 [Actinobacteria bacterium]|nr:hypothetical protein [Actinomycetota bacterium]